MSRHEKTWWKGKNPFILGLGQKKDDKYKLKHYKTIWHIYFLGLAQTVSTCVEPMRVQKKKKTLYRCMQGWGKFYSWSGFTTCVEAVKTNQWVHVYTLGGGQWKIKNRQWRWGMSRLRKRSTKPVQAHLLIKITALLFEQVTTKEDGWVVK